MDTVTQIALGAAVGEAVMGRQVGRRALLWGGVCGLFPDLDILIPFGDAVKTFTYHRGASHSLFVLTLLTPLFVRLILRLAPDTTDHRRKWYVLVFLALTTHVLLDCFTVYGTQIFWPLSTPPAMWSTIFIIDPLYSLPLFGGVLAVLTMTRSTRRGHVLCTFGLVLSTAYLIWSAGIKMHVDNRAAASLHRQDIAYRQLLTVPAPFNTVLWRILVMDDRGYYEGFYSLLDPAGDIRFEHHSSETPLLEGIANHWPVMRLKWFTGGFYAVRQLSGDIVMTDLRMGMEPGYVFRFKVGEIGNPHSRPAKSRRLPSDLDPAQLKWVWQRIWNP